MKNSTLHFVSCRKAVVIALLAFGSAHAEDDEVARLTKPDSAVSAGVGVTSGDSKDRALFGEYNGMRKHDANLLLDLDLVKRDDATGTWTILQGRNLGLENRDLSFTQQKQGDWRYSAEYSELTRNYPRTINTGVTGAETTTPTVNLLTAPGRGSDLDLKTTRKGYTFSGDKWISPSLQVEANFKQEDKEGARLFGRGFTCTSPSNANTPGGGYNGGTPAGGSTAIAPGQCSRTAAGVGITQNTSQTGLFLLPEPINSKTRQVELKVNYAADKLALSGGYYGSFFTNAYGSQTPSLPTNWYNPLGTALYANNTGGLVNADLRTILGMPLALPPDNQAHQFSLSGTYAFSHTTRSTFKFSRTRATQHEDFASMGLIGAPGLSGTTTQAPGGRTNLGGVVDTTLAQVGLTMRPLPKLSLLANVRYEDKKDKTPVDYYTTEAVLVTNAVTGANTPVIGTQATGTKKKLAAKLEGTYQLPEGYRATLGVDYEQVSHGKPDQTEVLGGVSGIKDSLREVGYRGELRRTLSETLTGALAYSSSRRTGTSNWMIPNAASGGQLYTGYRAVGLPGYTESSTIAGGGSVPVMFMDRQRDKVKLMADWAPIEKLSVQVSAEAGKDNYRAPEPQRGLKDAGLQLFSLDMVYALSDDWKISGYGSYGDQTTHVDHSTGYRAALKDINKAAGIGVAGKPNGRLDIGANLTWLNDRNKYDQTNGTAASQLFLNTTGITLPDVVYRSVRLALYGKYALEKNSDIRFDLVHQRITLKEFTWSSNGVPFVYSDNTSVSMQEQQNVTFIGARYVYKWQ